MIVVLHENPSVFFATTMQGISRAKGNKASNTIAKDAEDMPLSCLKG